MYELDDKKYPRSWKEMSFDFKLLFVFHGCMMVLFVVGRIIPIQVLIVIVSVLLLVLAGLSVHRRMTCDWHWPGVEIKDVLHTVFRIALGLFFLGAATPRFSPLQPAFFPWFAGGGGIILFLILSSLKIVFRSESEFQSHCGDQSLRKPEPVTRSSEVPWKKVARAAFSLYFLVVWIVGVSFFWKYNAAFRDSTPEPTAERTETLTDHGNTVYITAEEKKIVSVLERSMMIGVPSALLLGALLHFIVGVKLIPHAPTLAEIMRKTSRTEN